MIYPKDELVFIPLGGAEQIGMNLNLYGYKGQWLIVDMGVSFGEDLLPNLRVTMVDPEFLIEQKDHIVGLVITHAHEDHLGAVQYIWNHLKCPIYGSPFTCRFLKEKLIDTGLYYPEIPLHTIQAGQSIDLGPFAVDFVPTTHSVLQPCSLVIRTDQVNVFHSGDWKFDHDPLLDPPADLKKLVNIGSKGIDVLVCDSTNVDMEEESQSEGRVLDHFRDLVKNHKTGYVVVTCFATNVARLHSVMTAAKEAGKKVCLLGRSLKRVYEVAHEMGYLNEFPLISPQEIKEHQPKNIVLICTGSQGEPRSALSRLSLDQHPWVTLKSGDLVVFSSREIPGNEKSIFRVQNHLISNNIEVVTVHDQLVHVSGHPGRQDLIKLYDLLKPHNLIPVHGEPRHLACQSQLAQECGIENVLIPFNGCVISIKPETPIHIIHQIKVNYLCVDGPALVNKNGKLLKDRSYILWNGNVFVTLMLDQDLKECLISAPGLVEENQGSEILEDLKIHIHDKIKELDVCLSSQDHETVLEVKRLVRRFFRKVLDKRPVVCVHIVR